MTREQRPHWMHLLPSCRRALYGWPLFHVWTGVTVASVGYELSHARELGERLSLELQELEFELAAQTAPARLEEEARLRLGLEPPSAGQVVDLR